MQKHFPTIWLSSIEHMNAFSELGKKNPWWKTLLFLNKVPISFPQVKIGMRIYPLVFYSECSMTLFERQLDIKGNSNATLNNQKYQNLRTDFNLEIDYDSLTIDRYLHPKPFMKAFNIPWINLSISKDESINNILISLGGVGLNIKQVAEANAEIFELLKSKTFSKN